jgi:hypothetical protein
MTPPKKRGTPSAPGPTQPMPEQRVPVEQDLPQTTFQRLRSMRAHPVQWLVALALAGLTITVGAFFTDIGSNLGDFVSHRMVTSGPRATATSIAIATPSPTVTPTPIRVSIEMPTNNSLIGSKNNITVRVKGAPDMQVWALVQFKNDDSVVYPQGPCDNLQPELTVCRDVSFGDASSRAGIQFMLTVVIIKPSDAVAYRKHYENGFLLGTLSVKPIASSRTILVHRR